MSIFFRNKKNIDKIWSEEDYSREARNALALAIGGWILSGGLVGIAMEVFVFEYANRALKSKNEKTIQKAELAKSIASIFWLLVFVGVLWLFGVLVTNWITPKAQNLDNASHSVEKMSASFIGLNNGSGLVRSCPSSDCEVIKYGGICPLTEVLSRDGDWYKVKFTERGIYDESVDQQEICGHQNGRMLPENSWNTVEGWMPAQVIPPNIRSLFI